MLEKLQIIQQRFDEVSDLIIQPDIIADQKRYIQLNKEYKDLTVLVEKAKSYKNLLSNLKEAEQLLKNEKDAEMLAMAKLEIEEAKEKLPNLEEEIKSNYHRSFCSDGFFWGQQFQEESMKEYKSQDLKFLKFCKEAIKDGKTVVYTCSW